MEPIKITDTLGLNDSIQMPLQQSAGLHNLSDGIILGLPVGDILLIIQFVTVLLMLITIVYSAWAVKISKKQLRISRQPELFIKSPNFIQTMIDLRNKKIKDIDDLSSVWYSYDRDGSNHQDKTFLHLINGGLSSALDIYVFLFCDIETWMRHLSSNADNNLVHFSYRNKSKFYDYHYPLYKGVMLNRTEVVFDNPDRPFQIPYITQSGDSEKSLIELPDIYNRLINLDLILSWNDVDNTLNSNFYLPPIYFEIRYRNIEGDPFTRYSRLSITHKKNSEFLCETKPITLNEFKTGTTY